MIVVLCLMFVVSLVVICCYSGTLSRTQAALRDSRLAEEQYARSLWEVQRDKAHAASPYRQRETCPRCKRNEELAREMIKGI